MSGAAVGTTLAAGSCTHCNARGVFVTKMADEDWLCDDCKPMPVAPKLACEGCGGIVTVSLRACCKARPALCNECYRAHEAGPAHFNLWCYCGRPSANTPGGWCKPCDDERAVAQGTITLATGWMRL